MKRGWLVLSLVLALGAILAACFGLFGQREPSYQGRSLSSWLGDLRSGDPEIRTNGVIAIRQMGTNAVPFLIRMLNAKDSGLKIKLVDLVSRQRLFKVNYRYDFQRRDDALRGLGALGPDAKIAVPELAKLLNSGLEAAMAGRALHQIGPEAIPVLK